MTQELNLSDSDMISSLLTRGFYSMVFQPIIEVSSLRPFGFEALLRGPAGTPLASPCRLFSQDGYIEMELLSQVDNACMRSAVRTSKRLPFDAMLFLNIHGHTLRHMEAADFLCLLSEANVDPERVVLEISEKTRHEYVGDVAAKLKELKKYGIKVALDDVGSNNPFLYHLLCMEPEYLKVDRVLVQGIDVDPRKQALMHGLSMLARRMGASLIAEGIESYAEFAVLEQLEVPLLQGYFFGRPKPAEDWLVFENCIGRDVFYSLGCSFFNGRSGYKNF